ncbi:unnamed protein product, partial [Rotaria sp. Silwood2]
MKEKIFPPDHIDIAVERNNVAKIYEIKQHLQHAINAVPIPKARARNMLQYSPTNSGIESDKLHYELQYRYEMEERPELDYEVEEYGTSDEDSAKLHCTTSSSSRPKVSEICNTKP